MQRLHEQDLTGHVLERGGYHHLCLPAEYEAATVIDMGACEFGIEHEPKRKEDGDLLWPNQFGTEALERLKIELGPYGAAGQLQQRPSPRSGMILDPNWFKQTPVLEPGTYDTIAAIDLNYSDSERSDYTVAMLAAVDRSVPLSNIHIRKVFAKHLRSEDHFKELGDWILLHRPMLVGIEKRAFEHQGATRDLIRRIQVYLGERGFTCHIVPLEADRDKVTRAMIIPGRAVAETITVDKQATWWTELSKQMSQFPKSAHDDYVDALAYIVRLTVEKLESARAQRRLLGHSAPLIHADSDESKRMSDWEQAVRAGWR